jgi:hypothetical protein
MISFNELSIRLVDDLGNSERNCIPSLAVPRRAIVNPPNDGNLKAEVELPLFVSTDRTYKPTLDLKRGTTPTPDARLRIGELPDQLTLSMGTNDCRFDDNPKYTVSRVALLGGKLEIKVARSRPALRLLLWPDNHLGTFVEAADRERIWADVVLSAFTDAVAGTADRWREFHVQVRGNDGGLKELPLPSKAIELPPEVTRTIIANMSQLADAKAAPVVVRFDDSFLKRLTDGATGTQVVVIVGQTAERIRFCESDPIKLRFLKNYEHTSIVIVDMMGLHTGTPDWMRPLDPKVTEMMTCSAKAAIKMTAPAVPATVTPAHNVTVAGASQENVSYVAIVVPQVVSGQARAAQARAVLARELKSIFERATNR